MLHHLAGANIQSIIYAILKDGNYHFRRHLCVWVMTIIWTHEHSLKLTEHRFDVKEVNKTGIETLFIYNRGVKRLICDVIEITL